MIFFQETEDMNLKHFIYYIDNQQHNVFITIFYLFLAAFLSACSSPIKVHIDSEPVETSTTLPDTKGWWYAQFRIARPGREPQWYLGTMLAAEVIAPVLKAHRPDIDLWRFHRRAAHDKGGHLFSFIFYSTPVTADNIYRDIHKSAALVKLREEEKVTWVGFNDVLKVEKPNIEDTSDKNWPEIIQKTWPKYIMGASQMWLDLASGIAENENDVLTDDALYRRVQAKLTEIWMTQGKHVWLHHLNALYAYQPLLIRY